MFCVCYKKVNKVFWFKYWFYIGYVLIFLFMYDYICLYMLVIIDDWVFVRWLVFYSVWVKWIKGIGIVWLLYLYDFVLKYKLFMGMNLIR